MANTWRRSWNRTFLHPACDRILLSLWLAAAGASGASSFLGEGNIHREETVFLYSFSASTTGGGRITVRIDALVFGSWISSSSLLRYCGFPACLGLRQNVFEIHSLITSQLFPQLYDNPAIGRRRTVIPQPQRSAQLVVTTLIQDALTGCSAPALLTDPRPTTALDFHIAMKKELYPTCHGQNHPQVKSLESRWKIRTV